MKEIPKNMSVVWHRGSKSFAEVIKNRKKVLGYEESEGQLSEQTFKTLFQLCLGLARADFKSEFQYTRYDHESIEENENNAPFREGTKTINIFGYKFKARL